MFTEALHCPQLIFHTFTPSSDFLSDRGKKVGAHSKYFPGGEQRCQHELTKAITFSHG